MLPAIARTRAGKHGQCDLSAIGLARWPAASCAGAGLPLVIAAVSAAGTAVAFRLSRTPAVLDAAR